MKKITVAIRIVFALIVILGLAIIFNWFGMGVTEKRFIKPEKEAFIDPALKHAIPRGCDDAMANFCGNVAVSEIISCLKANDASLSERCRQSINP